MKVAGLLLHTDFIGEICDGEARDGKLILKRGKEVKEFLLSVPMDNPDDPKKPKFKDVKPFMLVRGKFGNVKPLYLVKWNSLYPLCFEVREGTRKFIDPETNNEINVHFENLEIVSPSFKDTKVLPELLGETHDLRFLKGMKKYATEGESNVKGIIMFALIALIAGAVGYAIYYFFFKKQSGG